MINKARLSSSKNKILKTSEDSSHKKPFKILNLSELLDHRVIPPSETIMRDRLTTQRSTRNQDQPKLQNYRSNTVKPRQRTPLKINYQHYRSKSSSTIKNYYESIKSPFQNKPDFVKLKDSQKNSILFKSKSLILSPEVKGMGLAASYQSQQLVSKNSFKIQNFAFRQQVYASSKSKSSEAMLIMSLEYKKNVEQNRKVQVQNREKEKEKIKFLKKGSSLQKQIVVNLLKNKLIKEHQQNTKKQYTECDILSMVKLYKGFLGFPKSPIKNPQVIHKVKVDKNSKQKFNKQISTSKDLEFLRTYQSLPQRIVGQYPKPIVGWETSPELDIQDLKNQHHTEITMDHSYGLS